MTGWSVALTVTACHQNHFSSAGYVAITNTHAYIPATLLYGDAYVLVPTRASVPARPGNAGIRSHCLLDRRSSHSGYSISGAGYLERP